MSWRSDLGLAAVGAPAGVALVSAAGLFAGYDPAWTLTETNRVRLAHYALASGVLGGLAALAWRREVRISAALGAVGLLVGVATRPTGGIPRSLASLNTGLTASFVAFVLAAAVEYGIRNPDAARSVFTRRATVVGVAAGVFHAAVVLALRAWLGFSTAYFHVPENAVIALWTTGGVFLVGFVAAVAAVRFQLVSPPLVVGGTFAWAVYGSWSMRESLRSGATVVGTGLDLYGWLWFVVLGLALGVGGVEWALRRGLRGAAVDGTA